MCGRWSLSLLDRCYCRRRHHQSCCFMHLLVSSCAAQKLSTRRTRSHWKRCVHFQPTYRYYYYCYYDYWPVLPAASAAECFAGTWASCLSSSVLCVGCWRNSDGQFPWILFLYCWVSEWAHCPAHLCGVAGDVSSHCPVLVGHRRFLHSLTN